MNRKYGYLFLFLFSSPFVYTSSTVSTTLDSTFSHSVLPLSIIPHNPISILNDSGFDYYGFTGSGSSTEPYIIENLLIETLGIGIEIQSTTKYFVIQNCFINSTGICIKINSVAPGTVLILSNGLVSQDNSGISIINGCHYSKIKKNIVVAKWTALDMFNCDNSEISGNYFCNSSEGIFAEESENCLFKDNTIYNNGLGMLVAFSTHATIINNHVLYNTYEGIATDTGDFSIIKDNYCEFNQYGIFALLAQNLTITNNTLIQNSEGLRFEGCDNADISKNKVIMNSGTGMCLSWSANSHITYNNFKTNGNYGLVINSSSVSNTICLNNFIDNFGILSQAYCTNSSNIWYDSLALKGNYWSDLSGSNYTIAGPAECVDLYPLSNIVELPIETTPEPTIEKTTNPTVTTISFPAIIFIVFIIAIPLIYHRKRLKT